MSYLGREAAKAPIVTADLPDNGVSLAKMTGGTDGNIISYDASGNPVAIATGSDGQVLTSTGAGSPPAFEAGGVDAADIGAGVLPSDVTGGSGLTALGTVTSGSIAGASITSATTFPSGTGTATGHVLQSQYGERTANYTNNVSGTVYYKPFSDTDCVITPISTSNKYFVSLSINSWWVGAVSGVSGGDIHRFVRLSYTPSGGSEVFFGTCDYWASDYSIGSGDYAVAQGNLVKRIDVPSALATTFKFEIRTDQSTLHILPNGSTGVISLTVSEVQA